MNRFVKSVVAVGLLAGLVACGDKTVNNSTNPTDPGKTWAYLDVNAQLPQGDCHAQVFPYVITPRLVSTDTTLPAIAYSVCQCNDGWAQTIPGGGSGHHSFVGATPLEGWQCTGDVVLKDQSTLAASGTANPPIDFGCS